MEVTEQQLIGCFRRLEAADRATLIAFAEFLAQRDPSTVPAAPAPAAVATPAVTPPPEPIERPASETVVGALKRLSRTYPMLDKSQMLSATSDLVAQHILQGTAASEAIDALEQVFREHYRQLQQGCDDTA
jgi:hypothetical protein